MINGILQFIKKTILAIKLARHNALCAIAGLKTFNAQLWIARLFIKKNDLPLSENLRRFLQKENNLFLNAAADEITARPDIVGNKCFYLYYSEPRILRRETLFKTTGNAKEKTFWLKLFAEIVRRDYPQLKEQYNFFLRRLDILQDMRFYASELEELEKAAMGYASPNAFEVDWIRSGKDKLYMIFEQECSQTNKLSRKSQEDFAALFAYLFFEKNWFVSSWQGVAVMPDGRIALPDFDFLYPVTDEFKAFAKSWFKNQATPANDFEFKLARAFKLLQAYCPAIDVAAVWQNYLDAPNSTYKAVPAQIQLLHDLQRHGVVVKTDSGIAFDKAEDLSYLLDSRRHKNDPRFRKSTVWYWGPLLIAVYVLYNYF